MEYAEIMQSTPTEHVFDYIITGTGCAGLSLLLHILQEPSLRDKRILMIDSSIKDQNDKTWCFWEKGIGFLENLVHHSWEELIFNTDTEQINLQIVPLKYKMIRSIDLYNYAKSRSVKKSGIKWLQANVSSVGTENGKAFAIADNVTYSAQYVFNSILFEKDKKVFEDGKSYKLLQHFKGWVIETKDPVFEPNKATFMDFRVSQSKGCTFVYVLPLTTTKALVEYTFFNEELLPVNEYDGLLKDYLHQFLGISDYSIVETEYGIIPMTNHRFKTHDGNIINMGTAAGWTKATSGFTFQFIQKYTYLITDLLVHHKFPLAKKSFLQRRFNWYDATLLNVLHHNKMMGKDVFQKLFTKQKATKLLRFLDNESNLKEEIQIMSSVPLNIFLPAAISEFF